MSPESARSGRISRTRPSSADIGFMAIGVLVCFIATFAIPIPDRDASFRVLSRLVVFALGLVVVALAALLLRGTRGDWKGVVVWLGKGQLALAALFVAVYFRDLRTSPSSLITALRTGRITIDRFVRAERAAAPGMFDQRLLRNNERSLRESLPDSTISGLSVDSVTEGQDWMRVHMTYQGIFTVQGESVTSAAQIVLYYHRAGTAVITAACTTEPRDCAQIEPLLAAAERSLRARFATTDLDGVLPASQQCSVETLGLPNRQADSRVLACVYSPGIQLTLTRVDAEATIRSLIAERSVPE
jgi:hypothetical protein